MRDIHSELTVVQATKPQVLAATDTSAAIDLRGYNAALAVVNTGAIVSAGDFTTKLQHSDTTTGGDFVDVPAGDLMGAFPASLAADSVYRVGYKGAKRYLRTVTTKNSGTSIAAGIVILKGHGFNQPEAAQ